MTTEDLGIKERLRKEFEDLLDVGGPTSRVGGASMFTALTDVPNSFAGHTKEIASVNSTEDGLVFTPGVTVDAGPTISQLSVVQTNLNADTAFSATAYSDSEYSDPSSAARLHAQVYSQGDQTIP